MTRFKSNNAGTQQKSRAMLRLEAFLKPRLARSAASELRRKSLRPGEESEDPELAPAEHRLQQLRLFRQRQMEDAAGIGRRSARALKDVTMPGQLNWVPIGPAGVERGQAPLQPVVSGRMKGIAAAPGGNRVYVATANGGVWYSGDTGKTWRPLMDQINFFPAPVGAVNDTDSLACGAIALVPGAGNSNDKIYLGTGEGDGMTDSYLGVGPLMSPDGGTTWVRETANPSLTGQGFYAIVVDPDDPERAVAGTSIGVYVREPAGGGTYQWNRKGLNGLRVTGLVVSKGKGGKRFHASVWSDKVYVSADGNNWNGLSNGFPTNRIGRIAVAACPHNADVVYALIAFDWPDPGTATAADPLAGNFHSVQRLDHGFDGKWYVVNGVPTTLFGVDTVGKHGQGNYDNVIQVAPNNENRIYVGGSGIDIGLGFAAAIYRCDITVTQAAGVLTLNVAAPVHLGDPVHADVHALVFVPGDPDKLWAGTDGGAYFTNQAAGGTGNIFESKNKGLQTLTINYLANHPTEEEVLFCGAQDNGGLRYAGENIWLHSSYGDGGYYAVNWDNPAKVISSYHSNHLRYNDVGGNRAPGAGYGNENAVDVQIQMDAAGKVAIESVLFYAPLANVPPQTGLPAPQKTAQANMLAFGTERPWISIDFGRNWFPIPSGAAGNLAQYNADVALLNVGLASNAQVSALAFINSTSLLVGMTNGRVFRFNDTSANNNWSTVTNPPIRLDTQPGGLPAGNEITDFAVDPTNANRFYVSLGGTIGGGNGHQHIWFYNGASWSAVSGNGATALLDVHFNAIIINPLNANQLFAGSDIGAWMSNDAGANWAPFSNGLPETPVMDLNISVRNLGGGNNLMLLRASTYGRGVFECDISPGLAATPPVQVYLRDNFLDRGRFPTRTGVNNPLNPGNNIPDLDTPDIKVDVPDANGVYQFAPGQSISPGQFYLDLVDKSQQLPVAATGTITSRVYVQVHNRGISPANNVLVMLLIQEITGPAMPNLPAGYDVNLKAGIPITTGGWKTVGIQLAQGVQAGYPKVISFDLPSSLLPAHGTLGGGKNLALVALLHHAQSDVFSANAVAIDPATANNVTLADRKITVKQVKAVQSAAIPSSPPRLPLADYVAIPASATAPEAAYDAFLGMAFRINDGLFNQLAMSRLAQIMSNRGFDGAQTNPDPKLLLFADTITIDADTSLTAGMPLTWFARRKITISKTLNAKGLGAPRAGDGDFGGAGGGGATSAGKKCSVPRSNPAIDMAIGGGIGANAGANLDLAWASRALLMLPFCKGAGAGGDDGANLGGLGGGIVVLCAPVIEFAGDGKIDAAGANGAANAGGGGGGLIVLIAGEIIGLVDSGATPNVIVAGGTSSGTGGAGGAGLLLRKVFR